jgi:hypothetical protein
MYAFFSGLANALASKYNEVVGQNVLVPGGNLFVDDLPDTPAVALCIFSDSTVRNPSDITRRPEFEVAARAERGRAGDAAQMSTRIYAILDRNANLVHGYPCIFRAMYEPVEVGYDSQRRPVFVTRYVVWGTKLFA